MPIHKVNLQYKDESKIINLNGSDWIQLCKDSKGQLIDTSDEQQILTIEYPGEIKLEFSIKITFRNFRLHKAGGWSENQVLEWCQGKYLAIEAEN